MLGTMYFLVCISEFGNLSNDLLDKKNLKDHLKVFLWLYNIWLLNKVFVLVSHQHQLTKSLFYLSPSSGTMQINTNTSSSDELMYWCSILSGTKETAPSSTLYSLPSIKRVPFPLTT
jgi:hypothetical protein